jgi:RNA polymerase sigma-70 factor, ECF subfamily
MAADDDLSSTGPATPLPEPIDALGVTQSSVPPITPAYTPVERDEVAILLDAAAGEPVAVRILLDVHMPTVYGFVFARVGGRAQIADEITQETLEQAVRTAATFRGESSLATWLRTIARRGLARHYDHERRAEEAGRAPTPAAAGNEETPDRRGEVVRALGTLPPSQRQALVLKYLDHLSDDQVAAEMGKALEDVRSMLQRGRQALKKELDRVG